MAITEAKGDIEVAVYTGRMNKDELVTSTKIDEDRRVREAVQQADAKVIDSRSPLQWFSLWLCPKKQVDTEEG